MPGNGVEGVGFSPWEKAAVPAKFHGSKIIGEAIPDRIDLPCLAIQQEGPNRRSSKPFSAKVGMGKNVDFHLAPSLGCRVGERGRLTLKKNNLWPPQLEKLPRRVPESRGQRKSFVQSRKITFRRPTHLKLLAGSRNRLNLSWFPMEALAL